MEVNGFRIYPVEKNDWYSGDINSLWANGAVYTVFDVNTKKTWRARRLYGGNHADIEPYTAADTAVLCQMYNVSSASQILENTHYHRRPSLVTIGNRTFACSLYGVPHGEQAIYNNNYDGQACLHFKNSKKHNSGTVCPDHQAAINVAYQYAKSLIGSRD